MSQHDNMVRFLRKHPEYADEAYRYRMKRHDIFIDRNGGEIDRLGNISCNADYEIKSLMRNGKLTGVCL